MGAVLPAEWTRPVADAATVRRRRALVCIALLATLAAAAPVAPSVVFLAFTPAAVAVAWVCLRTSPALYVELTLWVVFLSPLVRRLVEYRLGYRAADPILLAPLLVPGLALAAIGERAPRLRRRDLRPFALAFAGIACGFAVGVVKIGALAAGYGFVTWMAPLAFGGFVAMQTEHYPEIRRALTRAFPWALVLLGAYGVVQFVAPAPWDVYWIATGGQSTVLDPRPFHLRIFGPLNSFGPFAAVLLAGLLVALAAPGSLLLRVAAVLLGVAALLMTQVRTAWGGLVIGVLLLVMFARGRRRRRAIGMLTVVAALVAGGLPLALATPEAATLRDRLGTLGNLSADQSYVERQAYRAAAWDAIVTTPEGAGTGATGMAWVLWGGPQGFMVEQGEQDALYSLGWIGGTLYLGAVLVLMWRTLRGGEARDDGLGRAARAAVLALFLVSFLGNVFVAVGGTLFWAFVGAHGAARRHARLARQA